MTKLDRIWNEYGRRSLEVMDMTGQMRENAFGLNGENNNENGDGVGQRRNGGRRSLGRARSVNEEMVKLALIRGGGELGIHG